MPLPAERPFADRRPVRLGIVGRIVEQKQHRVMLDACALLRQRLPDAFRLDIVGTKDGPFAEALEVADRRARS